MFCLPIKQYKLFFPILISACCIAGHAQNIQTSKITSAQIPKSIKYKGKVVGAFHWKDLLGDNILITSWLPPIDEKTTEDGPVQTAELFAYHYETEKDFKSAPKEFLNLARQRWLKYAKETFD